MTHEQTPFDEGQKMCLKALENPDIEKTLTYFTQRMDIKAQFSHYYTKSVLYYNIFII